MGMPPSHKDFLTDEDFETSKDFLAWLVEHPDGVVITQKGAKLLLHLADCGHFKGADQLEWVKNGTHKGLSPNRSMLNEHGLPRPGSTLAEWVNKQLGRELNEEDWCHDRCRQRWASGA